MNTWKRYISKIEFVEVHVDSIICYSFLLQEGRGDGCYFRNSGCDAQSATGKSVVPFLLLDSKLQVQSISSALNNNCIVFVEDGTSQFNLPFKAIEVAQHEFPIGIEPDVYSQVKEI